jgi:hypothetical protein
VNWLARYEEALKQPAGVALMDADETATEVAAVSSETEAEVTESFSEEAEHIEDEVPFHGEADEELS